MTMARESALEVEAYVVVAEPEEKSTPGAPRPTVAVEDAALRPTQRRIALATIWVPFLGTVAAIALAIRDGIAAWEIALLVSGFVLTSLGIELGLHRALAHRAFETHRWLRVLLAVLGSMAAEGRVLYWVASHRRHHAHSDTPRDPHSPHVRKVPGREPERLGMVRGLWHAHVGHMITDAITNCTLFAKDLQKDPAMRRVSELYVPIVVLGLLIPAAIGAAVEGTWMGALRGFLWGGLARMFVVHHTTWSVASICHRFGGARFETGDLSRNNLLLALPSFGSAYQNNHHAFPSSAYLGLKWWEIDLTAIFIRALSAVGLVWNVRRPEPEQIERQLRRAARVAVARGAE